MAGLPRRGAPKPHYGHTLLQLVGQMNQHCAFHTDRQNRKGQVELPYKGLRRTVAIEHQLRSHIQRPQPAHPKSHCKTGVQHISEIKPRPITEVRTPEESYYIYFSMFDGFFSFSVYLRAF